MFDSMTDIEKAIAFAEKNHKVYDDYYDSLQECIESAMAMARWKDEQYKEEKKKLLEKMSKWILENINKPFSNGGYISYVPPKGVYENVEVYCAATRFVKDLKNIMEGEKL